MKKERLVIGPSTGWMYYRCGIYPNEEQESAIKASDANALESSLYTPQDPKRADFLKSGRKFSGFEHVSLHLDDYNPSKELAPQVELAKAIFKKQNPRVALVHPLRLSEEYFRAMSEAEIPLAIENMDKNKPEGFKIKELERLISDYSLGFVLDVQHAYEHDSGMNYAEELLNMGKDRLTHLHVSGETPYNNHSLVHYATNQKQILDFTGKILEIKKVPIILEGEYRNVDELKKEISFLRKEFGTPTL